MSAPIVGYRAWRVDELGRLLSIFEFVTWPVGAQLVAECRQPIMTGRHPDHAAPYGPCRCGIYARTTLAGIFDELWRGSISTVQDPVIGVATMYGSTYHGTSKAQTIRAEYAQPLCLLTEDAWYPFRSRGEVDMVRWRTLLERASQRYGLPIIPRSGIEHYAAEYGEQIGTTGDSTYTLPAEPRWRAWWPWGRE
jgi:hypothetical protein